MGSTAPRCWWVENNTMKKNTLRGILITLGICAAEFCVAAFYLFPRSRNGELLSVSHASENLPGIFVQSLISFLIPAVLLILFAVYLKKDFAAGLYLTLRGKWQRIMSGILFAAALGLTAYCLIVKEDRVTILFSLLYYFVFIAFAEEFVCRDVCTYFLRDASWPIRYLIPNICFAVLHVFAYANWSEITGAYLLRFFSSDMLGLVAMGCCFQLLKEKSGTIWLPVLLHGLMDFTVVLKY